MRNGFPKNERIGTTLPTAWSRPTHIPCKHDIPKYSADPAERILTTKREIRISAGRRTFRFNRHTAIAAGKRRTRRTPAAATAEHACPAPPDATTPIPARLGGATAAGPRRTAPTTAAPYDGNDKWSDRIHRSGTERLSFPLFLGKTHKRSSGTQRVGTRCFRQENRSAVPSLKNRNHPCRRLFRQG